MIKFSIWLSVIFVPPPPKAKLSYLHLVWLVTKNDLIFQVNA